MDVNRRPEQVDTQRELVTSEYDWIARSIGQVADLAIRREHGKSQFRSRWIARSIGQAADRDPPRATRTAFTAIH